MCQRGGRYPEIHNPRPWLAPSHLHGIGDRREGPGHSWIDGKRMECCFDGSEPPQTVLPHLVVLGVHDAEVQLSQSGDRDGGFFGEYLSEAALIGLGDHHRGVQEAPGQRSQGSLRSSTVPPNSRTSSKNVGSGALVRRILRSSSLGTHWRRWAGPSTATGRPSTVIVNS